MPTSSSSDGGIIQWEYLNVSILVNSNGNIDLVLRRDKPGLSQEACNKIDAYFNISESDCDIHLHQLKLKGWELEDMTMDDTQGSKTYYFKRPCTA